MNYNFMRGKQMVIHDPRVKWKTPDGDVILNPPAAYNTWRVSTSFPLTHILDHASKVADGVGKLDAITFIGHGEPGKIQLGSDGVSTGNIEQWQKLAGKVRVIIMFSCNFGGDVKPGTSGKDGINSVACMIASLTQAKVIACKEMQRYANPARALVSSSSTIRKVLGPLCERNLDLRDLVGDVYICYPNGGSMAVYRSNSADPNSDSSLNLESYVFNGSKH